jgi:signal transduction histidine kinase
MRLADPMRTQGVIRDWLWRELRIGVPVPILCAAFFSTLFAAPFLRTLVSAFCISLLIQVLVEGGRYGMSWLLRRHRPDHLDARNNWPGWRFMGPWVIIASVAAYFPGYLAGDILLGVQHAQGAIFPHPRAVRVILAVIVAVSASCVYFLYMRGRMATLDARAQMASRNAAENQLKLLESQLEPHMLFNTLANLRVLIGTEPAQAQAMLDHLTAFLRAMLDASRTGAHPLEAEFGRIKDYLELMQVRMGERLQSTLALPAHLAALPVPPMLLQPLVENAIKHGLEPQAENGVISIAARREGDTLVLTVRDNGAGIATHQRTGAGFGLHQVRERLAALYGSAATLELSSPAGGGAMAEVRLPISQDQVSR